MANPARGEIEAELDGRRYTLVLTLGALAELEQGYGEADLLGLAERFTKGRLSARDAVRILGAGLRGAGHDVDDRAVAAMRSPGGAAGYVEIVARLLAATFNPVTAEPGRGGAKDRGPFPGSG